MHPPANSLAFQLLIVVPVVVVSVFSLVAAMIDLWRFRVHNLLTFPLLISGVIYHTLIAYLFLPEASVLDGLQWAFAGIGFGFGVLVVPYVMGGMGSADVKLMAAVGAWLGLVLTFCVFLISGLLAGLVAATKILWHQSLTETWEHIRILGYRVVAFFRYFSAEENLENAVDQQRVIPFGAVVALGVLTTAILLSLGAQ